MEEAVGIYHSKGNSIAVVRDVAAGNICIGKQLILNVHSAGRNLLRSVIVPYNRFSNILNPVVRRRIIFRILQNQVKIICAIGGITRV